MQDAAEGFPSRADHGPQLLQRQLERLVTLGRHHHSTSDLTHNWSWKKRKDPKKEKQRVSQLEAFLNWIILYTVYLFVTSFQRASYRGPIHTLSRKAKKGAKQLTCLNLLNQIVVFSLNRNSKICSSNWEFINGSLSTESEGEYFQVHLMEPINKESPWM